MQALLDSALDPVSRPRPRPRPTTRRGARSPLTVIDPACGSGHFLLAAARRIATRLARQRRRRRRRQRRRLPPRAARRRPRLHPRRRPQPDGRRAHQGRALDRDRRARPPARLPRRQHPLRRRLLGVFDLAVLDDGIPDAAYKPLTGDDKDTARDLPASANRARARGAGHARPRRRPLDLPDRAPFARALRRPRAPCPRTTSPQSPPRPRTLRSLREARDFHMAELACNLYVAAFLLPKTGGPPPAAAPAASPPPRTVWQALRGEMPLRPARRRRLRCPRRPRLPLAARVPRRHGRRRLRRGARQPALGAHQAPGAGVLRRPRPARSPRRRTQAARDAADRGSRDRTDDPPTATCTRFRGRQARRRGRTASFARATRGRFPLTAAGDVNTYALFAELFLRLAGPKGRAGVIVPTGIATDATTAPFFGDLVEQQAGSPA